MRAPDPISSPSPCGRSTAPPGRPRAPRLLPGILASLTLLGCVGPGDGGVGASGDTEAAPAGSRLERVVVAMATTLRLQVDAADRDVALRASEAAVRAVQRVEARLSTWRDDSELSRLNRAPVGTRLDLSGPLLRDLATARRWARATGYAFDPGVGALVDAYDLRGAGRWPSDQTIWSLLPASTIVELHVVRRSAERRARRLRLEEGGFAKGAALDAAAAAALAAGATAVTLDFGGQMRFAETNQRRGAREPHGSPAAHELTIADPQDRERPAVALRLPGGSVATTANSERRRSVDGRDLGHLLDPRTGRPARDFGSLTVWVHGTDGDAFAADCLSTALFVLGPDAALTWAERHDRVEALVLQRDVTGQLQIRASSGLAGRVQTIRP